MAWRCPKCKRSFGRKSQWHSCAPSRTVDDYFAKRPASLRRAFDAIARDVKKLGDVHIEPVKASVMIKRARTFAEVRAKGDELVLSFLLSRVLAHPRVTRTFRLSAHRTAHSVIVTKPSDVDRTVRGWLAEAYASSPE